MNDAYLTFSERLQAFWKKNSTTIIGYLVCFGIGALLVYIFLNNYNYAYAQTDLERYLILTNAFTIPGVVFACLGALSWVSQEGVFDSLAYASRSLIRMFRRGREHVRYYDFVIDRREKRKEKKSKKSMLLITGLCFLLISFVFLYLYYQCPQTPNI